MSHFGHLIIYALCLCDHCSLIWSWLELGLELKPNWRHRTQLIFCVQLNNPQQYRIVWPAELNCQIYEPNWTGISIMDSVWFNCRILVWWKSLKEIPMVIKCYINSLHDLSWSTGCPEESQDHKPYMTRTHLPHPTTPLFTEVNKCDFGLIAHATTLKFESPSFWNGVRYLHHILTWCVLYTQPD